MIIKILIISAILVAFIMLPYIIHLFFDKDSEFTPHKCAFDEDREKKDNGCSSCQLKELADYHVDKKRYNK